MANMNPPPPTSPASPDAPGMAEIRASIDKLHAIVEKDRDRALASLAELDRKLAVEVRDRHGLKDSLSRGVEDSFAASLKPLMAEYGVPLDDVLVRVRNANHGPEVDILGLNGTTAVVGEVKLQLKREDVSVFSDDLRDFRDDFPEHARPTLYGVVAGMTIDDAAAALARKRGFFILQLDGAIVSPQTSKDFRPRPY